MDRDVPVAVYPVNYRAGTARSTSADIAINRTRAKRAQKNGEREGSPERGEVEAPESASKCFNYADDSGMEDAPK